MNHYTSILKNRKSNINEIKPDYSFKLVLVGEAGVGKTSIFNRIKEDIFSNHTTIGLDQCSKLIFLDNGEIVKVSAMVNPFYIFIHLYSWMFGIQPAKKGFKRSRKTTTAIPTLFSSCSPSMIYRLSVHWWNGMKMWKISWRTKVLSFTSNRDLKDIIFPVCKVLVGNKKDCSTVLSPRSVRDFCDVRNCAYSCATSALTGDTCYIFIYPWMNWQIQGKGSKKCWSWSLKT